MDFCKIPIPGNTDDLLPEIIKVLTHIGFKCRSDIRESTSFVVCSTPHVRFTMMLDPCTSNRSDQALIFSRKHGNPEHFINIVSFITELLTPNRKVEGWYPSRKEACTCPENLTDLSLYYTFECLPPIVPLDQEVVESKSVCYTFRPFTEQAPGILNFHDPSVFPSSNTLVGAIPYSPNPQAAW